jgi:hypothetical protein
MPTSNRAQKNNTKDGDVVVNGKAFINSGVQFGGSGVTFGNITVVSQAVDLGATGSSVGTIVEVAYTSGAAGIIGSGDYCIPLNTNVGAASGLVLQPGQTTTGDSLAFSYANLSNANPPVLNLRFLILKNVGV